MRAAEEVGLEAELPGKAREQLHAQSPAPRFEGEHRLLETGEPVFGLFPDAAVQAAVIVHGDDCYWPQGTRRTRPSRLHVTLHFLGNVEHPRQQALRALQQRLSESLPSAGLATSSRRWTPHVTLARDAPRAGPPDTPCDIAWPVAEVTLVWSHYQPTVRCEVLARYPATRAA